MKKILVLSLVVAGLLFSPAAFSQLSYGVKGGLFLSRMTYKSPNIRTKLIPTFKLGGYADYQIKGDFFIRPELMYAMKGSDMPTWDAVYHLSYIEIPVSLLYKHEISGHKIQVGLGPYIGFGIGGTYKESGTKYTVKFKNKPSIAEWNNDEYFKPIDIGAKLFVGYEMKNGLTLALESSRGLANIEPDVVAYEGTLPTVKHLGFGITASYKLK
jgi:hypothetical protein